MDNDDYYLESGFDPSTLKVSAIRNILVKHEVEYPSNAKKGELIGILQSSVLDKAGKLRKEAKKQRRIKGDGRDIEVVATTSSSSIGARTRAKTPKTTRTRPSVLGHGEDTDMKGSGGSSREASAEPSSSTDKKAKKKAKKAKLLALAVAKESSASSGAKEPAPSTPEGKPASKLKSKPAKKRKHTGSDSDRDRKDTSADSGDETFFTPAKPKITEAQRQRIAKRRILHTDSSTHGSGRSAATSDSESEYSDRGTAKRPVTATTDTKPRSGNFSDDNPFQSSPEASRKRRRKTSAAKPSNTPMAALRKSQPSDVLFRVALPTSPLAGRPEPNANGESVGTSVELEADQSELIPPASPILRDDLEAPPPLVSPQAQKQAAAASLQRSRVSDLVAKYQNQEQASPASPPLSPTVRIRDGLKKTPSAISDTSATGKLDQYQQQQQQQDQEEEYVNPTVDIVQQKSARSPDNLPSAQPLFDTSVSPEGRESLPADSASSHARFTMTPDALRQMASERAAAQPSRRKTVASGLPPVAPNIPVTRADMHQQSSRLHYHSQHHNAPLSGDRHSEQPQHAAYLPIEQAESDAQTLQRRRVATLRQRSDSTGGGHGSTHSRRSSIASIASSIGEERGIPAIPTPAALAAAAASADSSGRGLNAKEPTSWTLRVMTWAAISVAVLVWRTHNQFAIGFGSSRSDHAPLAPPVGSALALPEPIDMENAPLLDRASYYARLMRASYVSPPALECPEHAECIPYTPIPPSYATQLSVADATARDQWVVPVIDASAEEDTPNEVLVPVVQCDQGYVLQFPRLSSRIYPRTPICVRDVSTEHRVHQLATAMIQECDSKRGRVQCEMSLYEQARELLSKSSATRFARMLADPTRRAWGKGASANGGRSEYADMDEQDAQPVDAEAEAEAEEEDDENDEAEEIERLGLNVKELKRTMLSRKSPRLSNDEFDVVFKLAVDELANKHGDEVANFILEFEDEDGAALSGDSAEMMYFVSRNPAYPFVCRVRRFVLNSVIGNLTGLLSMIFLSVVGFVASRRYAAHRAELRAADALVVSALERLKRQARRHYLDPALSPSPAIPSLQLRDLLLLSSATPTATPPAASPLGSSSDASLEALSLAHSGSAYYDPRARNNVWERVRKVVERNANVRCRTTAVRGEPMRVWEWIGPLDHDDNDDVFSPFASPLSSPQRLSSPITLDRPLE